MKQKIKVIHVIDSFFAGGAERMSLNLANSVNGYEGIEAFLCATRIGGDLEDKINHDLKWIILNKQSIFDFRAYYRFIQYVKLNDINILHAHSSSFFISLIAKIFTDVKIVWHVHYGKLAYEEPSKLMIFFSKFFDYTIVVNKELYDWGVKKLGIPSSKIEYMQNFADLQITSKVLDLPGEYGKRIVCVGNVRDEKDHLSLCKAMSYLKEDYSDWTLLLVGEEHNDDCSAKIHQLIQKENLTNVYFLGVSKDVANILNLCDIGVISSKTEGLPLALLEYGLAGLSVVSTDVGECTNVIENGKSGVLIPKEDPRSLYEGLKRIIEDTALRQRNADKFTHVVEENYSKEIVISRLNEVYRKVL